MTTRERLITLSTPQIIDKLYFSHGLYYYMNLFSFNFVISSCILTNSWLYVKESVLVIVRGPYAMVAGTDAKQAPKPL